MEFTLNKFEQPSFRVSVENSGHESFFVARNRTTGSYTVFGPVDGCTPDNMQFADIHTGRDERTVNEFAASSAVRRAICIERERKMKNETNHSKISR
jgi:hypothetical protein